MVKMNESAANIKFMECRMKGRQEKFVMQMEYTLSKLEEAINERFYNKSYGDSEKSLN